MEPSWAQSVPAVPLHEMDEKRNCRGRCDRGHGTWTRDDCRVPTVPDRIRASRHRRFPCPCAWDATVDCGTLRAPGMSNCEPLRVDHATGEAVLRQALEGKAARPHPHSALIALCLHDDDRAFVEGWCIRLGRAAPDPGMRMVAALGISYLACRFRTVDPKAVELVRTLAADGVPGEPRSRVVGDALRRLERCIG